MRFAHLGLAIALLAPLPVLADIAPYPPQPPPPAGPAEGDIRGVGVTRYYVQGGPRRRGWKTSIESCAPSQAACGDRRLTEIGCLVVGVDEQAIAGGDIAALVAADKAAKNRPIRIRLEDCGDLGSIELHR